MWVKFMESFNEWFSPVFELWFFIFIFFPSKSFPSSNDFISCLLKISLRTNLKSAKHLYWAHILHIKSNDLFFNQLTIFSDQFDFKNKIYCLTTQSIQILAWIFFWSPFLKIIIVYYFRLVNAVHACLNKWKPIANVGTQPIEAQSINHACDYSDGKAVIIRRSELIKS